MTIKRMVIFSLLKCIIHRTWIVCELKTCNQIEIELLTYITDQFGVTKKLKNNIQML
jgi:hypothetical protein